MVYRNFLRKSLRNLLQEILKKFTKEIFKKFTNEILETFTKEILEKFIIYKEILKNIFVPKDIFVPWDTLSLISLEMFPKMSPEISLEMFPKLSSEMSLEMFQKMSPKMSLASVLEKMPTAKKCQGQRTLYPQGHSWGKKKNPVYFKVCFDGLRKHKNS